MVVQVERGSPLGGEQVSPRPAAPKGLVRALMETHPAAVLVTDGAGNLTAYNSRAAELWRLPPRPSDPPARVHDLPLLDEAGRPFAPGTGPWDAVLHHGRRIRDRSGTVPGAPAGREEKAEGDGRGVPVAVTGAPLTEGTGAVFVVEDRSRVQNLMTQLRQAQKLEAMGRLAGGMAHDFNNQLMVIQGYCDRLAEELAEDETLLGYVEKIRRAAERSAALTSRVLAFGRRHAVQREPVALGEVVRDLASTLRRTLGEDIRLLIHTNDAPWCAMLDRALLEQCIMNLAINARDAMPDGGELVIATALADLDDDYARRHPGASPGPHVVLTVSDTGVGMDHETLKHIFEPFFTTKEEGRGTGLGLATVYGFVKQCRGHIYVYSEPGHGTTFKLYFPRVSAPAAAPAPARSAQRQATRTTGHRGTILVAEDDREVRQLLVDLLRDQGYTLLAAGDGAEALRVAEAYPEAIDLLIADTVMPGGRGPELAERLRRLRPGLKVIYTSGYPKSFLQRRGLIPPEAPWLSKPFNIRDLTETVRRVLEEQPADSGNRDATANLTAPHPPD